MAISAHFGDLGPETSAHFGDCGPVTLPQKSGPRSLRPLWAEVTKVGRVHRNVGRGHLVRDGREPRSPVPENLTLLYTYPIFREPTAIYMASINISNTHFEAYTQAIYHIKVVRNNRLCVLYRVCNHCHS